MCIYTQNFQLKKQNKTKNHNISSFGAELGGKKKTTINQINMCILPSLLSTCGSLISAAGTLDCKIMPEQCWGERKLCVKTQRWFYFYYVSERSINIDVRDYLEQQNL